MITMAFVLISEKWWLMSFIATTIALCEARRGIFCSKSSPLLTLIHLPHPPTKQTFWVKQYYPSFSAWLKNIFKIKKIVLRIRIHLQSNFTNLWIGKSSSNGQTEFLKKTKGEPDGPTVRFSNKALFSGAKASGRPTRVLRSGVPGYLHCSLGHFCIPCLMQ